MIFIIHFFIDFLLIRTVFSKTELVVISVYVSNSAATSLPRYMKRPTTSTVWPVFCRLIILILVTLIFKVATQTFFNDHAICGSSKNQWNRRQISGVCVVHIIPPTGVDECYTVPTRNGNGDKMQPCWTPLQTSKVKPKITNFDVIQNDDDHNRIFVDCTSYSILSHGFRWAYTPCYLDNECNIINGEKFEVLSLADQRIPIEEVWYMYKVNTTFKQFTFNFKPTNSCAYIECIAQNEAGIESSEQFILLSNDTTIRDPSQPHCLRNNYNNNQIKSTIDEEVVLKCSFPKLNLAQNSSHWEKDDKTIEYGSDIVTEHNEKDNNWFSLLRIPKMKREDVGWYKCTVRDSNAQLYTRSVYLKMIVLYSKNEVQPYITLKPADGTNETISIHTGESLKIAVEYDGYPERNIAWSVFTNYKMDAKKHLFKEVNEDYFMKVFFKIWIDDTKETESIFEISRYLLGPSLIMVTADNSISSAKLIFKIIHLENPRLTLVSETDNSNFIVLSDITASSSKVVRTLNYTPCTLHFENNNCDIIRENTFQISSILDPRVYKRFYELEIIKTLNKESTTLAFEPEKLCSIIEVFAQNEYGNNTAQTQMLFEKDSNGNYYDLCRKMFCIRGRYSKEHIVQEVGSKLMLTCSTPKCGDFKFSDILQWTIMNGPLISEKPNISIEVNETKDIIMSILRIKHLNYSNKGTYICHRSLNEDDDGDSIAVIIKVADRPSVSLAYLFMDSDTITATCEAQSDFPVKIKWIYSKCKQLSSKNTCGVTIDDAKQELSGAEIKPTPVDVLHDKKEMLTLILPNECNVIECFADNGLGNSSAKYLIFRKEKLNESELVCIQDYENYEKIEKLAGDDLTLNCVVPNFFQFSVVIIWMKNWSILDDEKNDIFLENDNSDVHSTVSLKLRNLTHEDTGLYLCRVHGFLDNAELYKAVYLEVVDLGASSNIHDAISSLYKPVQKETYQTFVSSLVSLNTSYIPVVVKTGGTLSISATIFGNYLLNMAFDDHNNNDTNYSIIRIGNKFGLKKTNYTHINSKWFEFIYNNQEVPNQLTVAAKIAIYLLDKPHVKLNIHKLENETKVICVSESSLKQNITLIHTKCHLRLEDNNCDIITKDTVHMPASLPYDKNIKTYMPKFEFHKISEVVKFNLSVDCGIFECLATNEFGYDSNTKNFIINPDDNSTIFGNYEKSVCIRGFDREVIRNIGEEISMECSAVKFHSNWFTDMTWYKEDEIIDDNLINKTETEHHYIVILTLTNLKTENKGLYKCVYNSTDGQYVKTLFLDVIDTTWFTYLCITASGTTILGGVSAYFIFQNQKKRTILKKMGIEFFEEGALDQINPDISIEAQAEFLPYDKKFEIPKENISLGVIIGAGEFGVVHKATCFSPYSPNQQNIVAVKKVTPTANYVAIKALTSELKIMIYLGQHLNIVKLFGAVTNHIIKRKLMIVVEFCQYGNLRTYIQNNREHFIDQIDLETDYIDFQITSKVVLKENTTSEYYKESDTLLSTPEITSGSTAGSTVGFSTMTLLAWSFQIARGMNYLSSKKIIHGDLAARNVLLCEDNIIKICDFGLAKILYKSDIYKRSNPAPLPFKWLVLETMTEMVFSTYTDVWAFGVTLWELFSMAQLPYPEKDVKQLFIGLQSGYRMSKPGFANYELYKIMLRCWSAVPEDRPLFNELEMFFENILPEVEKNRILGLSMAYEGTDKKVTENPVVHYKLAYSDEENIEIISGM